MRLKDNAVMKTIMAIYEHSLHDLIHAIEPVPDADLAQPMGAIVIHPAWTLSHLCGSAELICQLLHTNGTKKDFAFFASFGPGSQPEFSRSTYLTKPELITALRDLHAQAVMAVQTVDEDLLSCPPPAPFEAFAPTIGDIVMYLFSAHESYHLSLMLTWLRTWNQQHESRNS